MREARDLAADRRRIGDALFSPCQQYRYLLTRILGGDQGVTVFVMLNPSTADEFKNDPTVRRCVGYAQDWGSFGLIVANLYALRSTDPKALWTHDDPVGPSNDQILTILARHHRPIICAWGANAKPDRVKAFVDAAKGVGGELMCLGTTKDGAPRHPLYLRRDAKPQPWSPPV